MSFNDSATLDNLGYGFAIKSIYSEDHQTEERINNKIIELNNIINENIPNRPNGVPNSSHGHRDYRTTKSAGSNRNNNKKEEKILIGNALNSKLLNESITTNHEVSILRPNTVGTTELLKKTPEILSSLSVLGSKRIDNGKREKITNAVMFM